MVRKNLFLALVLAFFCAFVVPEKKAEAFIFRAAARAIGAVVGFTAGVVAGTARVVANTVGLAARGVVNTVGFAARGVARLAVGAFRLGRFALFGRPFSPMFVGRGGAFRNDGIAFREFPQGNFAQNEPMPRQFADTHMSGDVGSNPRSIDFSNSREAWCANHLPLIEYSAQTGDSSCKIEWEGSSYWGNGRNEGFAVTYAQRKACEAGANPEALLGSDAKWCTRQMN